jgi:hypothetical protein
MKRWTWSGMTSIRSISNLYVLGLFKEQFLKPLVHSVNKNLFSVFGTPYSDGSHSCTRKFCYISSVCVIMYLYSRLESNFSFEISCPHSSHPALVPLPLHSLKGWAFCGTVAKATY